MNGFEVTHPWKATDHAVLLVYNRSMGMKIFTFRLPGQSTHLSLCLRSKSKPSPALSKIQNVQVHFWTQGYQNPNRNSKAKMKPHSGTLFQVLFSSLFALSFLKKTIL